MLIYPMNGDNEQYPIMSILSVLLIILSTLFACPSIQFSFVVE